MGQAAGVGCSFGTIHLCASEDRSGAYVLPSRCAGSSSSHSYGKFTKSHNLDLGPDSWQLGTSAFGTVLRGAHRASGEQRAVRVVPKRRCEREPLLRELELLRTLDHPNLVRFGGVVEDSRMVWIVMESAPGKDLFSAVIGLRQVPSEWLVAQLLRQVLLGLQHLHAAGLVHQDVQPRNVLASERPMGQDLRLKIIDFGLSGKYGRGGASAAAAALHANHCSAPEQVSGSLSPRTSIMEPSCDIWAVGVLGFALLSGEWPIDAESPQLLQKKLRTGLWGFLPASSWIVSEQAKALVSSLMAAQPGQRPAAAQALEHPFLRLDGVGELALRPLARGQEVLRSLLRITSRRVLREATVGALAKHLHEKQLAELRRHLEGLDPTGRGLLTLQELRRGLVQADIQLPGRLIGSLLALKADEGRTLSAADLAEAAAERRRALEEVLLWTAWSHATPDGPAATLAQEEVVRLLELNAPALRMVFGASAPGADEAVDVPPLPPDPLDFDALLRWVRNASAWRGAAIGRWPLPSGMHMSAIDLSIRIPPPVPAG